MVTVDRDELALTRGIVVGSFAPGKTIAIVGLDAAAIAGDDPLNYLQ